MNHPRADHETDGNDAVPPENGAAGKSEESRRSVLAGLRFGREARIGTAALLSFLILVGVLLTNKWKTHPHSGKQPPVVKIANPNSSSQIATVQAQTDPASVPEHPDKTPVPLKEPEQVASETAAPPLPAASGVTADLPPPVAQAPDLKVPNPAQEPSQPTMVANQEPALPPATAAVAESGPAAPAPMPVTLPPADLPPVASTSAPEISLGQAQTPPPPDASIALPPIASGAVAPVPIPDERRHPDLPPSPSEQLASVASTPVAELSPAGVDKGAEAGLDTPVTPVPPPQKNKGRRAPGGKGPSPQPTTIASDPSGGPTRSSDLPTLTAAPHSPDPAVAATPKVNPFDNPAAAAGQGGWSALPNTAARQNAPAELKGQDGAGGSGLARTGASTLDAGDLVESVPHTVASGENFFSIAQQYYGSGRFYQALWKANSDQVPAPAKLRVGQTIRIPPPEALDRSLILPPRTTSGSGSNATAAMPRTTRSVPDQARSDAATGRSSAVALALPVADPFGDRPRPGNGTAPGALVAAPAAADRGRLPRYKIRPQETLRSIARDVLGDSRRGDEILELNREVIDDPNHLTPGQQIDLPEDARLVRRVR